MRILGIDPGLTNTGYGIIDHENNQSRLVTHGCIITSPKDSAATRLKTIYDSLTAIIADTSPEAAAIERLFFSINVKSAMAVGEGRGVAILATAAAQLTVAEYTPQQIKQAVSGSGKAGKDQVSRMVGVLLGLRDDSPQTSHAADALAVALCHAHSSHFQAAVENSLAKQLLAQKLRRRR